MTSGIRVLSNYKYSRKRIQYVSTTVLLAAIGSMIYAAVSFMSRGIPKQYESNESGPYIRDDSISVAESMIGCTLNCMPSLLQIKSSGPMEANPYRQYRGFLRATISNLEYDSIVLRSGYLPVDQLDPALRSAATLNHYGDPDEPNWWSVDSFRPNIAIVGSQYGEGGYRFMVYQGGSLYWYGNVIKW